MLSLQSPLLFSYLLAFLSDDYIWENTHITHTQMHMLKCACVDGMFNLKTLALKLFLRWPTWVYLVTVPLLQVYYTCNWCHSSPQPARFCHSWAILRPVWLTALWQNMNLIFLCHFELEQQCNSQVFFHEFWYLLSSHHKKKLFPISLFAQIIFKCTKKCINMSISHTE